MTRTVGEGFFFRDALKDQHPERERIRFLRRRDTAASNLFRSCVPCRLSGRVRGVEHFLGLFHDLYHSEVANLWFTLTARRVSSCCACTANKNYLLRDQHISLRTFGQFTVRERREKNSRISLYNVSNRRDRQNRTELTASMFNIFRVEVA